MRFSVYTVCGVILYWFVKEIKHEYKRVLVLCLCRQFSPRFSTLPQSRSTRDFWSSGEIQTKCWWLISRVFGCIFSLAFCQLKPCWNTRRGKYEIMLTVVHVSFHFIYFDLCLLQLFYNLHHVPGLLSGVGQRCEIRSCHAVPRVVQRSVEGIG